MRTEWNERKVLLSTHLNRLPSKLLIYIISDNNRPINTFLIVIPLKTDLLMNFGFFKLCDGKVIPKLIFFVNFQQKLRKLVVNCQY